jgi:hypothetical protein
MAQTRYKEYFYCVDRAHSSALHGDRCAACREVHANFADESVCLMVDNVHGTTTCVQ